MTEIDVHLRINDEVGRLRTVVVGIANDRGRDDQNNNPKYRDIVDRGKDPAEGDLVKEIDEFSSLLERYRVNVYRPGNLHRQTQIFARDVAFVIGDTLIKSRMRFSNRQAELAAVDYLFKGVDKILVPPADAMIEGGDVVLSNNHVFVGQGTRTNKAGCEFLERHFPNRKITPLYLQSTSDALTNVLHLDCAFQPVGKDHAIICEEGFRERPQAIYDMYRDENLIRITPFEMYEMQANIFSISRDVVVADASFERLICELERRKITVECLCYRNIGLLGGLLRCSTLPLYRD